MSEEKKEEKVISKDKEVKKPSTKSSKQTSKSVAKEVTKPASKKTSTTKTTTKKKPEVESAAPKKESSAKKTTNTKSAKNSTTTSKKVPTSKTTTKKTSSTSKTTVKKEVEPETKKEVQTVENKDIKQDKKVESEVKVPEKESKKEAKKKAEILEEKREESPDTNANSDDTIKEKKSYKTLIITGICTAVLIVLILLFSTIFAIIANSKDTIINGINIWGIDVSGLTKQEATEKLSSYLNTNLPQGITLKHNEYEIVVLPEQFNISFSVDDAINMAYNKGRHGNVFENNFEILDCMIKGNKINPGFSYNDNIFETAFAQIETNFSDKLVEPTYYIDETDLVIEKGKDGVVIDRNKLKDDIIYAFSNLGSVNNIEIPVINKQKSVLDLNKVHSEVYKAPKDAYYTTNPYAVYPHADGIDFAISMEEALNIFNSSNESCRIPLQVLSPNVTTNDIGAEAFPDLLATYYTNFSTSNWGRTVNIKLATEKINGTVIMPGEDFSFNQTVGKRTPEAGFQVAAVYAGGTVTTDYGGGICQVSSTLYNSVLLSNLEVIDRSNHMFSTGYVPVGRDATVSWGAPDFVFRNNRNYPVKILAEVSGGTVTVDIYGLATPDDYEVEIESYVTQYIGYSTIERPDPTLPKGTTQVIENGSSGCKSVCYRILKKNGEIVDKQLLSNDVYDPHNKIVAVGTKQ